MSQNQVTNDSLKKAKAWVSNNKKQFGILVTGFLLVIGIIIIAILANRNPLVGTWEKVSGDDKLVITKERITSDDVSLAYKLSDDGKKIVLTNYGENAQVDYKLDNDTLEFDGSTYYKEGSAAYDSAVSSSSKESSIAASEAKAESVKEANAEKTKTDLINKYNSVYLALQKELTKELAKKLNGTWQNQKSDDFSDNHYVYTKTFVFDADKLSLSYKDVEESKHDSDASLDKTDTEEGKATFKLDPIPAKYNYFDKSEYQIGETIESASNDEIKKATTDLKSVTLDNYFSKMHDLKGGYSDADDQYYTFTLDDATGDLKTVGEQLKVKFPKSDKSVAQLSFTTDINAVDYTKIK